MPTGMPSAVKPAGTEIAGSPDCALTRQLLPGSLSRNRDGLLSNRRVHQAVQLVGVHRIHERLLKPGHRRGVRDSRHTCSRPSAASSAGSAVIGGTGRNRRFLQRLTGPLGVAASTRRGSP